MIGTMRVPRSRGAVAGLLLVVLAVWGALIPFVGPYFRYAYTPDTAWTYTSGRLWLELVPAAAVAIGGLVLMISATRPVAMMGAWLAALGGAWFTTGTLITQFWRASQSVSPGVPAGNSTILRTAEQLGFFTGLGVVIVFVAGVALGRLLVIGVRDAALADRAAAAAEADRAAANRETAPVGSATAGAPATTGTPARTGQAPWQAFRRRTPAAGD